VAVQAGQHPHPLLGHARRALLPRVLRPARPVHRSGAQLPAWYRAHGDPVVGAALRLLDAGPGHPWTLPAPATRTGVSRASLAPRFTALVGQPPMTYPRERRLGLAADLLRDREPTLAVVADRVGFAGAFALSAAFKRQHGVSPSEFRLRETGTRHGA
jgi:AraC-like DNA-binding protein